MFYELEPIEITAPGPERPPEMKWVGNSPVIVHYDDIPESDITVHEGIRVTTPLRTVIDIATRVTDDHLVCIVEDCLERGLFTADEAIARTGEPDMVTRPGALLLVEVLRRYF